MPQWTQDLEQLQLQVVALTVPMAVAKTIPAKNKDVGEPLLHGSVPAATLPELQMCDGIKFKLIKNTPPHSPKDDLRAGVFRVDFAEFNKHREELHKESLLCRDKSKQAMKHYELQSSKFVQNINRERILVLPSVKAITNTRFVKKAEATAKLEKSVRFAEAEDMVERGWENDLEAPFPEYIPLPQGCFLFLFLFLIFRLCTLFSPISQKYTRNVVRNIDGSWVDDVGVTSLPPPEPIEMEGGLANEIVQEAISKAARSIYAPVSLLSKEVAKEVTFKMVSEGAGSPKSNDPRIEQLRPMRTMGAKRTMQSSSTTSLPAIGKRDSLKDPPVDAREEDAVRAWTPVSRGNQFQGLS